MTPLTRRATAAYRESSAAQREGGERWYEEAHTVARDQAAEHGVTIEITSGILAAMSPRMGWGPNVMIAERVLTSRGQLDHGALGRSLRQANAIFNGTPSLDVLGGPKTRAFYTAILTAGDEGEAVIDRHAWDMLTGIRGATPPTAKQYRVGAAMMQRAADILNQPVHRVQATTWLVQRHKFWAAGAFDGARQPMLEGASTW